MLIELLYVTYHVQNTEIKYVFVSSPMLNVYKIIICLENADNTFPRTCGLNSASS